MFLPKCCFLFLFALPTSVATGAESAARRNVLLIIADDHGLELGCYGHPAIRTPNLDALAAEGTRFTYAFATVSSCSASRSVIQTGLFNHTNGQYGHQHGIYNQQTHGWVRGISRLLAQAPRPYRTGIVGKNHVQPEEVYPWEFEAHPPEERRRRFPANRDVYWMAEAAGRFFGSQDERPFFLLIGYSDPHRSSDRTHFANHRDYEGIEKVRYSPRDVVVPAFLPDWPEVRENLAQYYQAVSRLDQGVGLVVEKLKAAGEYDNTLILYLSDNGIAFTGAKTNLYDPGIRLPLIVRSPDQSSRGVANRAMVSWVDILPTILDWAGVAFDARAVGYELAGRSFLGILNEEDPPGWDEVFASHVFHEVPMYYPMRAIRTRRYKLILNLAHPLTYPLATDLYASALWQRVLARGETAIGAKRTEDYLHRPRWELFDLRSDPLELRNLAADPAHAGTLEELQARLRRFQERTQDPWITKYEYE